MPYVSSRLTRRDSSVSDTARDSLTSDRANQPQTRRLQMTNAKKVLASTITMVRARGRSRAMGKRIYRLLACGRGFKTAPGEAQEPGGFCCKRRFSVSLPTACGRDAVREAAGVGAEHVAVPLRAEPSGPPAERAVGEDEVAALLHEPKVGNVRWAIADRRQGDDVGPRVDQPFEICQRIAEAEEARVGDLLAHPRDGLRVIGACQLRNFQIGTRLAGRDLMQLPEGTANGLEGAKRAGASARFNRGREGKLQFAAQPRRLVDEVLFVLTVSQKVNRWKQANRAADRQ